MLKIRLLGLLVTLLIISVSCDKNEVVIPTETDSIEGTGSFVFDDYQPLEDKPIQVYFHIPGSAGPNTPILLVFHGNGRDALESRDLLIDKANQRSFIVVVPEFSTTYFPGSDSYHMANIFEDGDRPSTATLNTEEEWTFMVMDPIFERVKELTANKTTTYDLFGHSAGAQITHRFLTFEAGAKFNRIMASASGWYTVPDSEIKFPYGLKVSPMENAYLGAVFTKSLTIIVGTLDTDPNSYSLRHNTQADAQGLNRLDRAQYYYETSRDIALGKNLTFNWQYKSVPNVGHDFGALANFAADLLYK